MSCIKRNISNNNNMSQRNHNSVVYTLSLNTKVRTVCPCTFFLLACRLIALSQTRLSLLVKEWPFQACKHTKTNRLLLGIKQYRDEHKPLLLLLNSSLSPHKPSVNFFLLMYWHSVLSSHTHQVVICPNTVSPVRLVTMFPINTRPPSSLENWIRSSD